MKLSVKEAISKPSYRRVLSYQSLDKILRANKNQTFLQVCPCKQQSIVRQAVTDFKAWLEALKSL